MHDVLDDLNQDILEHSYLSQVITKHKPDIIVDCVNSATALAYQDIFTSSIEVRKVLDNVKKRKSRMKQFRLLNDF